MKVDATRNAVALVIKNIDAVEEASCVADHDEWIGENIFGQIDNTIETFAKDLDLIGKFSFWEDDVTEFYPKSWVVDSRAAENNKALAKFSLGCTNEEEDCFWLTALCAAGKERIGFIWSFNENILFKKKSEKKAFFQERSLERESEELIKLGFRFDVRKFAWSIDFNLHAGALADAYRDDTIEDCLEPLDIALSKIRLALPTFEKLVRTAQSTLTIE